MVSPALNQAYRLLPTDGEVVTTVGGATGYRHLRSSSPPYLSNNQGNDPAYARWMPNPSDHGQNRSFGIGVFDTYLDVASTANTVHPSVVTSADLTYHGGNDDNGSSFFSGANSGLSFVIDSSRIYYILLGGYSSNQGAIDVWFPDPAPDIKVNSYGVATAYGYLGGGSIPLEYGGLPPVLGRATVRGSLQRFVPGSTTAKPATADGLLLATTYTHPSDATRLGIAAGAIRGKW
jgi:hypothetical protein